MKRIPVDVVALDFETRWADDYTLSRLSTVEYVRDPRFAVHCAAWQTQRQRAPRFAAGEKAVAEALASFDWSRTACLAHHAQFDGLVLSERFGVKPAFWFDTLSMARALFRADAGGSLEAVGRRLGFGGKLGGGEALESAKGVETPSPELLERLGEYNRRDVVLLWSIFRRLRPSFPAPELRLIDSTVKMQTEPRLRLDAPAARRELARERDAKHKALVLGCEAAFLDSAPTGDWGDWAGLRRLEEFKKTLMSSVKLHALLCGMMPEEGVPTKWSPKQKRRIPAFARTDLEFQRLAAEGPPAVRAVLAARKAVRSTIGETRCLALLAHSADGTRPLPVYLKYYGAHTGRWAGGDGANMQNLPVRQGAALRKCVLAPSGHRLVVVDSAQIEARILAWLAGQESMLDAFRTGADPYRRAAAQIYGKPEEDVVPEERFVGKTCVLGCGYGIGWKKYREQLAAGVLGPAVELPKKEAARIVRTFRERNRWYPWLWVQMQRRIATMAQREDPPDLFRRRDFAPAREKPVLRFFRDRVGLPNGMSMKYPDMRAEAAVAEYEDEHGEVRKFESVEHHYRSDLRGGRSKVYGGLMAENAVQALARIVVGWQMLRLAERWPVALMAHDEVVLVVPGSEADEAGAFAEAQFSKAPAWAAGLPVKGEAGVFERYEKP